MDLNKVKKLNIPRTPGSYQFLDKDENIIYVGKASNLRSRVVSYWQESTTHSPIKYSMMKVIDSIKWIETDSEIEALLLESNLIKKYQPHYNIMLRDDKRFAYIKISTEEKWPRIFLTRNIERSGKYFGPFTSQEAARETLKILRKIWPYRSCRTMSKTPCLYYRIGKCPGPCNEKIGHKEYLDIIKQIVLFLEGKKNNIIKNYELRIKNYEKELKNKNINENTKIEIEKQVSGLKYQLKNFEHILESAKIINVAEKYANDVLELAKILGLPRVPQRIEGYDISNIYGKDAVGSMVVFEGGEANKSEYRKFKIKIGEGEANDTGMLREVLDRRFKHSNYPLDNLPAQTGGGEGDLKTEWPLPDLIIIDGGKGQVNAGLKILKNYKLEIMLIGISKGEGLRSAHAPDKIFFPSEKKPLELPIASPALHLLKRVRDEAHRFAIEYHKKVRKKKFFNK